MSGVRAMQARRRGSWVQQVGFLGLLHLALPGASAASTASLSIVPSVITAPAGTTTDIEVRVSTTDTVSLVQFTLEYDSTVVQFVDVVIGSDLAALGFDIFAVNEEPPYPPELPGTNRNVLIAIYGGAFGRFSGDDLHLATLTYSLSPGVCDTSPLSFNTTCSPHTHLNTFDLRKICHPQLELHHGAVATDCATDTAVPRARGLRLDNVPNPFNPKTRIRFELPQEGGVRLEVYDLVGRRVRTLLRGVFPEGSHEVVWDGRSDAGTQLASGVYYCRLHSPLGTALRRVTLMK